VFERDPVSWVAQLDALDTVIFFLNYAQFERLDMTYTQFEMLNPRKQVSPGHDLHPVRNAQPAQTGEPWI
jgi:hypothetical protein